MIFPLIPWAVDDEFLRSRWRWWVERVEMMPRLIAVDDEFIYDDGGSWDEGWGGDEGDMEEMQVSHGLVEKKKERIKGGDLRWVMAGVLEIF